eukprot:GFUD01092537.1.p1 GENE.GFUD01092537.1~~GFUD01092537.1.p1  ORF type:complete len:334 (+),score=76.03 GFUD01092537.1:119-1120(+)
MMMNVSETCDTLNIPAIVGPTEVYSSIGHWNTAVYIILALHLLPVWCAGTITLYRLSSHLPPLLVPPTAWLVSIPPALMSLTATAIVIPSLGKYVEVLLEIVICLGLVKFIQLSIIICGGPENIVSFCKKRKIKLPIGSPPFVCFLPCRKPEVTRTKLNILVFAPILLLVVKICMLAIDLIFLSIGYHPSGDFIAYDNLHNILSFPVGLIAIYCYTMFNFIMNDCMEGNSKRFLGIILLVEFILFDCLRLFFIFLTGTGMLTCVAPFLSQHLVVHLLKNYIKAFLATGLGIPFIKLCSKKIETSMPPASVLCTSMSSLVSDESTKQRIVDVQE